MSSHTSVIVWPCAVSVILVLFVRAFQKRRKYAPPGPSALPIVGNILDFPPTYLGREFDAMDALVKELFSGILVHRSASLTELLPITSIVMDTSSLGHGYIWRLCATPRFTPNLTILCRSAFWTPPGDWIMFDFGFRVCPSRYFAESTLFILCACVHSAFEIGPPVGEDGDPVEVKWEATDHLVVSHPKVHKYSIKPRSSRVGQLVETALAR